MTNKTNAVATPLFGDFAVIMRSGGSPYRRPKDEEREPLSDEELQRHKSYNARKARENRQFQKLAERQQIEYKVDEMRSISMRNNAGFRHLLTFVNLVKYADEKGLPAHLCELTKRLGENDAIKEWKAIRDWLGKSSPAVCAVSIGRRPKGWWVLRWVIIGDAEGDCYKTASPFHSYLIKKKWITKAIAADGNAGKLKDHYLTRCETDEETFYHFVPEMFEVYRAGLSMPKTSRTYRSHEVGDIINERSWKVAKSAAYAVNGTQPAYNSSSGRALCEVTVKNSTVIESRWVCEKEIDYEEPIDEFDDDNCEF